MKPDDFEKTLQRQPLRQIPAGWREEILHAARAASVSDIAASSWLEILRRRCAALLWPHPRAWAGLAAVWVAVVAANFWSGGEDHASRGVASAAPPSRQLLQTFREQRRELARLADVPAAETADEPKTFSPRPRSERRREFPIG